MPDDFSFTIIRGGCLSSYAQFYCSVVTDLCAEFKTTAKTSPVAVRRGVLNIEGGFSTTHPIISVPFSGVGW